MEEIINGILMIIGLVVVVYFLWIVSGERSKKKSKKEPSPNTMDNFILIAQNITFIYLILKSKFASKFIDKQSLLATAGIINAMRYIEANEIEPTEIIAMARSSVEPKGNSNLEDEIDELSFFIRRLEVELFAIDTNLEYAEIRDAVSQKYRTIRQTVAKLFSDYDRDKKLNLDWELPIDKFMAMEATADLRTLVGINSSE